ncbi:MAG: hypothetical protein MSB11_01600 [Prevotella sp.]|nr:hypothetical protein [Prevotella sp.]
MAKIQIKSEKLTPCGGMFSIMEKFDTKPLTAVLLSHLPHHVFDKLKCLLIRLRITWCAFWDKEQAEEFIHP